jgi:hypothetical protein
MSNYIYKVKESRTYVWDVGTLAWVAMQQPILEAGSVTIGGTVDVSDRAGRALGVVSAASWPLPTGAATDATFQNSSLIDEFGRLRVTAVETLFDSKQIFSNDPLFWDDQETSGGGTTSSWTADSAVSVMGVALSTAGVRVRQTFLHMNYEPGKTQLIYLTGNLRLSGGGTGITARIGYFHETNGLFFENAAGTVRVVRRTHVSGSTVDNAVTQASWNLDTMAGAGPSGITLDWTKHQILVIDFAWLGVGRVRFGVEVGGRIYYVHEMLHSNVLNSVYMSTPNLPLRFELTNSGTGVASTMTHGCSTVISEGGADPANGVLHYTSTTTLIDANAAGTLYALLGIKLKTTALGQTVQMLAASVIALTADDFEWQLLLDPTVAGTFTYADLANTNLQAAYGATANTVTGGIAVAGGQAQAGSLSEQLGSAMRLGSSIAGTPQAFVLAARPRTINADFHGSLSWRELQ